jgi:anti-sigma B factor antagonist
MELTETRLDAAVAVAVKGRVDSTTAWMLGDKLASLVHGGNPRVVVDFKDVDYISSAGFRTLLIAKKLCEHAGGELALCGVGGEVLRLFGIAAFTELFRIFAGREDAAAAIKPK